ncbi:S-adenosyl-L-methionine-dependent methyltransferase [Sphaerosporella brunnea]|uniref:S-adenosyl-L-methionine-dependent methyltransferase n=1 Tax=Sphaerosporella brunnea TaxID=1250544 RepID=A0A5J5F8Y6_9PEZI|nr:S-adenosyl-L-methionine-dependent methyltransferase [Sphaerosporella brunnea]
MCYSELLEVDPNLKDEGDSDYSSSGYGTSTASLSSSVNEFIFENGRRYHAYFGVDKNVMPTDEDDAQKEQDRLDLNHEVLLQQLEGELHKAPLKEPNRILDVGTGTGIWAIDMADKYPSAEVIGIDLSPIQPGWVPPNCKFEVDDAELDWTYASDSFDFIHCRNLHQGISKWPDVLTQAYRCLKSGAYIELSEAQSICRSDDGSMKDDNACKRYFDHLVDAMQKMGRPVLADGELEQRLQKAGFTEIKTYSYKQVWGPWPKDPRMKKIGLMNLLQSETAFHAYGMAVFTRVLGMSGDEADRICKEAYAATKKKDTHMYTFQLSVLLPWEGSRYDMVAFGLLEHALQDVIS